MDAVSHPLNRHATNTCVEAQARRSERKDVRGARFTAARGGAAFAPSAEASLADDAPPIGGASYLAAACLKRLHRSRPFRLVVSLDGSANKSSTLKFKFSAHMLILVSRHSSGLKGKNMRKGALVFSILALALLSGQLFVAVAAVDVSDEGPLCVRNAQNGCDDSGCGATGGVCGRAIVATPTKTASGSLVAASPCWCLY